jgi:hypothetical protein
MTRGEDVGREWTKTCDVSVPGSPQKGKSQGPLGMLGEPELDNVGADCV